MIHEDEESDIMVYDRLIYTLITESCGDMDEAEKILNVRPDEKDFLIKLRRKLTIGTSPFSPKNTIYNRLVQLVARKTFNRGTFCEILLTTFYPAPDFINEVLDAIEGTLDSVLFFLSEELYYHYLKDISGTSRVFLMILNNPTFIRKRYQPSKFLNYIFLNRTAEDESIDRLMIWNPKPHSYQLISALVQLKDIVFDEDYVVSDMTVSAANKWLESNNPIMIKSSNKY